MRGAIFARERGAANEKRRRKRIGCRAVASDDGGAADAGRGPAGTRVEHVPVAAALDLDELFAGAARAERAVAQVQPREPRAWRAGLWRARIPRAQIDRPAPAAPAESHDAAGAGGHERMTHAARGQIVRHALHGVA